MVVVGSVEDPKTHYVYTRHLSNSFALRMFTLTGMGIFTLAPLYLGSILYATTMLREHSHMMTGPIFGFVKLHVSRGTVSLSSTTGTTHSERSGPLEWDKMFITFCIYLIHIL